MNRPVTSGERLAAVLGARERLQRAGENWLEARALLGAFLPKDIEAELNEAIQDCKHTERKLNDTLKREAKQEASCRATSSTAS